MNTGHHKVKPFIDMIKEKVSGEFSFRIYPYEDIDILTCYFRGFKMENWRLDGKFWTMDDKERRYNVNRLRRRIKAIRRPADRSIMREILHTRNQIDSDKKRISSISM